MSERIMQAMRTQYHSGGQPIRRGCLSHQRRGETRIRTKSLATLIAALLTGGLIVTEAQAQFTANFQTNTINVASNWVDNTNFRYVDGSNTFMDALIINAGGVLSSA